MDKVINKPCIHAIAALGKNTGAIGKNGALLWRISEDLKRFKNFTMGHPVIMGRKTFESIGKPLPGRTNIVVTRSRDFAAADAVVTHSLEEAISEGAKFDTDIFIIGGGGIYREALPVTDILHLTLVENDTPGDTYFPDWRKDFTKEIFREERIDEKTGLRYIWLDLER